MTTSSPLRRRRDSRGQALVEFSLVLIPFLYLLMGIADLGRGIYANNGVAEAAREIARVTSVHPGATLGTSAETLGVIATQKKLVPGLADPSASIVIECTTLADTTVSTSCLSGNYVRVTVRVPFAVLTPLLGMVAPQTLGAVSHVQVP